MFLVELCDEAVLVENLFVFVLGDADEVVELGLVNRRHTDFRTKR